jgi:hypothetical protein
MKRPSTKLVDRITILFINHPYERAVVTVISGLWAVMIFSWHDDVHAEHFAGYFMILFTAVNVYFLARAIDTLRVEDTVPQPDQLVGLHLDQK